MVDLQKASLTTNGQHVTLTMPISKVDIEKRIVSGFATLDNIDRQGDRVTAEASQKAFENFRGNVRLMHQPIPAGKVVNFRTESFFDAGTNKQYNGVYVDAYISKGASDIWEMVLDGTLTGFSIGGNVKDSEPVLDAETKSTIRIIKDYDLVELSLVDSPANQLANIFSIQKDLQGAPIADGIFNKSNIQNVFWCEKDELAYTDENELHSCANCGEELKSIGWIDEITQENITKAVFAMIQKAKDVVTNEDATNKHPNQKKKFKSELKKAWSVVSDHPDCQGYAVVGDSGNLHGCFKTEAEAQAAVTAHNSGHGSDDNNDDSHGEMHMSASLDEDERKHGGRKKEIHKAGDFVQWNHNGKIARGRITKVITNGTIKVPNSDFTISGTEENPVVVIKTYVKDGNVWKPSGTVVGHRMNTLKTWATKVAKSLGVNTGLLPNEVVKKAIEIKSVANQISKGGVEVAENTENTTEEAVEEVTVDEVVEEVVEESETVVEEAPAEELEKSDVVAEDAEAAEAAEEATEEVAEQTSTEDGEATDIEKALNEIKEFVASKLEGSLEKSNESIVAVTNTVAEVTKALTDKIVSIETSNEEINKTLADITNAIASFNGRMEAVEEDTAVKKSGELENSPEKTSTMKKSAWGGRFLSSAEYLN